MNEKNSNNNDNDFYKERNTYRKKCLTFSIEDLSVFIFNCYLSKSVQFVL